MWLFRRWTGLFHGKAGKIKKRGYKMKTLYIIGGTMGVGKTTVCQQLKKDLPNCVFLDGDWCWDADPFQVTEETKEMVEKNIYFLLNNFIHCSAYENIVFCWVMHQQSIIDKLISNVDTENVWVKTISLISDEESLIKRIKQDIQDGKRTEDCLTRSLSRLPLYRELKTHLINTTEKSVSEVSKMIWEL